jgi:hypothetical protein
MIDSFFHGRTYSYGISLRKLLAAPPASDRKMEGDTCHASSFRRAGVIVFRRAGVVYRYCIFLL